MRSWVYRNRETLERVYGSPARLRPLTEAFDEAGSGALGEARERAAPADATPRLVIYHLAPHPPRSVRRAG